LRLRLSRVAQFEALCDVNRLKMKRFFAALLASVGTLIGCSFPDYAIETQSAPLSPAACKDDLLSAGEAGVDCGVICGVPCPTGSTCTQDLDCMSSHCAAGQCRVESCEDAVRSQDETDIDCGGATDCPRCATGKACSDTSDCDKSLCNAGHCLAPSCNDRLQNQDESDVDCGGNTGCVRCNATEHCLADSDCNGQSCVRGTCTPALCEDGKLSGDETSTDCGGSCGACADGAKCKAASDCSSAICNAAGVCVSPSCTDGFKNGSEPSVDCGASCPNRCQTLAACGSADDCKTQACSNARCVPASATGLALPTAGWVATANKTYSNDTVAGKAIDGNLATHWTGGTSEMAGDYFQVDMIAPQVFFSLQVLATSNDSDHVSQVWVQLSDDGKKFHSVTLPITGQKELNISFNGPQVARYIRLEALRYKDTLWWRIDELRVLQ
jgi:hypothetical protein